jgi:hypothetical protein
MAEVLYFSRDTKLYIEIGTDIWELPILDGYNFSQGTNSSEVMLAEMDSVAGVSRRGRRMFNDSLAPAEWSFSTYVRPFIADGTGPAAGKADDSLNHHAVEEVLWALMAGPATYVAPVDATSDATMSGFTYGLTNLLIDFSLSNKSTLGTANFYFSLDDAGANPIIYKLTSAVVNEAQITFDIDGIAMINWSGFAATITEDSKPTPTITEAISATNNFIRNRLTTLGITAADTTTFPGESTNGVYNMTLTGGSVTISNNMTYLTPEELGIVNVPIGHVTGGRSVSGDWTAYLDFDTISNLGSSADFYNDLTSTASNAIVTNDFALTLSIGGATAPNLLVTVPTAHLEIPEHSIEDVIAISTSFHGLPSTISLTDETTLTYKGV